MAADTSAWLWSWLRAWRDLVAQHARAQPTPSAVVDRIERPSSLGFRVAIGTLSRRHCVRWRCASVIH
jgi:hypothetical protein